MMQRLVSAFVLSRINYCNWNYIITAFESDCRCGPPSGMYWSTLSNHGGDARTALATNRCSYKMQTLSTGACRSELFLPRIHLQGSNTGFCPSKPSQAALLWSSTSDAFDVPCTRTEFGKRPFQWLDLRHGTVYLHRLDRLRTMCNSNTPFRLIVAVLHATFNCIFVFTS